MEKLPFFLRIHVSRAKPVAVMPASVPRGSIAKVAGWLLSPSAAKLLVASPVWLSFAIAFLQFLWHGEAYHVVTEGRHSPLPSWLVPQQQAVGQRS